MLFLQVKRLDEPGNRLYPVQIADETEDLWFTPSGTFRKKTRTPISGKNWIAVGISKANGAMVERFEDE